MTVASGEGSSAEGGLARIPTGIPGLDGMIQGGLVKNTVTIVKGGPGSGKSIFCMQFLVGGIQNWGEPGIYLSFEESEERILRDMEGFPWPLKRLIEEGKLHILHCTPEQVNQVLVTGGGTIRDLIDKTRAKRIVIDSLSAFVLLFDDELEKRKAASSFFEAIRRWDCTALVTVESDPETEGASGLPLEFEADAIIILYNQRRETVRERSLEILKMRGTNHTNRILPLKISSEGIIVYPKESVF